MKNFLLTILGLLFSFSLVFAGNEKAKTEKIIVKGTCGMCKDRIEDAAYIKGVKRADWDTKTKELVIVYNPQKTNLSTIEKSIAAKGHDAGSVKADPTVYKALPSCCAYNDDAVCEH